MIKRFAIASATLLILTVLVVIPVLAVGYTFTITVTDSGGSSYTQLPMIITVNNTFLSQGNYIASDGRDTRVFNVANTSLPRMVTNNSLLFVDNMTAGVTSTFHYISGYSSTDFPVITGYNGNFTTADNANLEMGTNFTLTMNGYFDSTAGKTPAYKQGAFKVTYLAGSVIDAEVLNASDVVISNVSASMPTGTHTLVVGGGDQNFYIQVDSGSKVTTPIGSGIPDNGNIYYWAMNNSMPYVNSVKLAVGN